MSRAKTSLVISLPLLFSSPLDIRPMTGLVLAVDVLDVRPAHDRVLHEVFRPAVDIGPGIDEVTEAMVIGKRAEDARAVDSRQGAQLQGAGSDGGAGVAGADHGVGPSVADEIGGDVDRRFLFPSHGVDRSCRSFPPRRGRGRFRPAGRAGRSCPPRPAVPPSRPTRSRRVIWGKASSASLAPARFGTGPKSPPMASRAILMRCSQSSLTKLRRNTRPERDGPKEGQVVRHRRRTRKRPVRRAPGVERTAAP